MKTTLLLTFIIISSTFIYGQTYKSETLDFNDVSLQSLSTGGLFYQPTTSAPGYEVPKGSGNNVIFASSFWFGGVNQFNDTLVSAYNFRNKFKFFSGPVSITNQYNSAAYAEAYDESIWKVSKAEIEYHIDNYDQAGYEAPHGIKNWPGNGDVSLGVSHNLAPYVDVNGDGLYNSEDGDYPCILGDEALYIIANDTRSGTLPSQSASQGLGIETHFMIYQFSASNFIDQTTFVKIRVINRGQNNYSNFKPTFYVDADIGFAFDDYIGCDTTNNVGYAYNAINYDPGGAGAPGYGNNPPAVGVVCLNHKMNYFGSYTNSAFNTGDPQTDAQYWHYMNGRWKDGSPWMYGGSGHQSDSLASNTTTKYFFSGNPLTLNGWSELNTDGAGAINPNDEDKRFLVISESQSFAPNQIIEYEYAIIFDQSGNNVENAMNVVDLAEQVNAFYMDSIYHQSCKKQGTGVPDDFSPQPDSIVTNQMFEITRLDGIGNMGLNQKIKPETEAAILDSNRVKKVHYQRGFGPVMAYIYDTLNHETGYFQLKFNNFNDNYDIDSAYWTAYRFDTAGGVLLDSVESINTITEGDLHYISQWGIAIKVKQHPYRCEGTTLECPERSKYADVISSSLTFENPSNTWLTGVKDNTTMTPMNWILKSSYFTTDSVVNINSPACYNQYFVNQPENQFNNLVNGIITSSRYTRYNECGLMPLQNSQDYLNAVNYSLTAASANHMSPVFHPGVDIVFTPDQSKWTRCPVIELNNDTTTSIGHALPGMLRQSPSVDKNGNPDNSGTVGMSWFPGYAIDVETGRRLNMAFCENSSLTDDHGTDMIWNPTDRIFDNMGNPVLGGQHSIYVFGGEFDGMPDYDEGQFLYDNLNTISDLDLFAVYRNLSWVMQPLLNQGHALLESEARVSVRISKEFKTYEISGLNNSKPMFEWNAVPYESLGPTYFEVTNNLHVFPNPANKNLTIAWDEKNVNAIQIVNTYGQIINLIELTEGKQQITVDVSALKQGIYYVKVGEHTAKVIIY